MSPTFTTSHVMSYMHYNLHITAMWGTTGRTATVHAREQGQGNSWRVLKSARPFIHRGRGRVTTTGGQAGEATPEKIRGSVIHSHGSGYNRHAM